jgi:hypothetical protein
MRRTMGHMNWGQERNEDILTELKTKPVTECWKIPESIFKILDQGEEMSRTSD